MGTGVTRFRLMHLLLLTTATAVYAAVCSEVYSGNQYHQVRGMETLHAVFLAALYVLLAVQRSPQVAQSRAASITLAAAIGLLAVWPIFAGYAFLFGLPVPFTGYVPGALARGWRAGLLVALFSPKVLVFGSILSFGLPLIGPAVLGAIIGAFRSEERQQDSNPDADSAPTGGARSKTQPHRTQGPPRALYLLLGMIALVVGAAYVALMALVVLD